MFFRYMIYRVERKALTFIMGGTKMVENRAEKAEALKALSEYNPKLLKAMRTVVDELDGNRKPDTDEYLLSIFKGINWETQIFNSTMDLLDEKDFLKELDGINSAIVTMNACYQNKDDAGMAKSINEDLIPFYERLGAVAEELAATA